MTLKGEKQTELLSTAKVESKVSTSTSLGVKSTYTEELIIALCGPIGSPLHKVADELKHILESKFRYECNIIRLSNFIKEHAGKTKISIIDTPKFEYIQSLINVGDDLRNKYGNGILADLAIGKIAYDREKAKNAQEDKKYKSRRICYVIDSLKNQEELNALKSVYHDILYMVGVFSPLSIREQNLHTEGMELDKVFTLIDRDSGEEKSSGQTVRATFPFSDFFLRIEDSYSNNQISLKLSRFLNIIFGIDIPTPSTGETAMYLANSAASNSACLSRQVGAALTDEKGEIISVGWNDVPKFGGGVYHYMPEEDPTSTKDKRCMHEGKCFNDIEKKEIANEIIKNLVSAGCDKKLSVLAIVNSKIQDLIEFSRSIHAEMHAILIGSQSAGSRVRGGRLYCTTYPCHLCAKHIITAGIKEVYYIEPYRKSLTTKLHSDAITEQETDVNKVRILMFEGVAPSRYVKVFRMQSDSRKDPGTGKRKQVDPSNASPIYEVTLESLPVLEGIVVNNLQEHEFINVER